MARRIKTPENWASDDIKEDTVTPFSVDNQQKTSQQFSGSRYFLPGGQEYQEGLVNASKNPRGSTPVPQWLREWEKNWNKASDKSGPDTW